MLYTILWNANSLRCFLRISMETHDSSLYNTVKLVPLIAPLIILPALLWTCSTRADCSSVMVLIRMSPYSKTGRMKDLYIISKVLRSRRYIRRVSISTRRPARFIQFSIWLPHERLLDKITPRCLCAVTSFITEAPNVDGGGRSFLFFNETSRDSVLDGQNETSHCSAHLFMVARSLLMLLAASTSSLKSINKVVSSANKRILVTMFSVISLMNIKNKRGPRTEPWGTPALIVPI